LEYPRVEETNDDWKDAEMQGDGSGWPRESETLIINTVYGLVRDVARNSDASNRGPTSYGNQSSLISVSTDHSEMDGGNDQFNKRPFLKKIGPRQQVKRPVEGTEKI
ncbi:hypothetical protein RRG08_066017, partial [Elysia crispata]